VITRTHSCELNTVLYVTSVAEEPVRDYASPRLKLKPHSQFSDWIRVKAFSVFRSRHVVSTMLHASHVWFPEVQG
jgi:hypothetical protein